MNLREERPGDTETVRRVRRRAFGDHGTVVGDLVDTLRGGMSADEGLALVAEVDGQVVGHVMFTRSLLDAPRRLVEVQVLSPLGVLPERQGRGIGSALVRRGLEYAAERAVPLVFHEGDPPTTSASASCLAGRGGSASRPCAFPTPPSRWRCSGTMSHG